MRFRRMSFETNCKHLFEKEKRYGKEKTKMTQRRTLANERVEFLRDIKKVVTNDSNSVRDQQLESLIAKKKNYTISENNSMNDGANFGKFIHFTHH